MTLGGWFRDYVYIPLGGNRVSKVKWVRNILVVWLLTGLWHGASWNFVVWGLMFAVLLLIEKWVPWLQKLPSLLRRAYVLLLVIISFVIFNARDLSQAWQDIRGMFGMLDIPGITTESVYFLRSYGPLLVAASVGATPLVRDLSLRLDRRGWVWLPRTAVALFLLLICTAYLVDGSFNPFLYFRF
jgi:alginate O-acetyltransferase complex protein AlgI